MKTTPDLPEVGGGAVVRLGADEVTPKARPDSEGWWWWVWPMAESAGCARCGCAEVVRDEDAEGELWIAAGAPSDYASDINSGRQGFCHPLGDDLWAAHEVLPQEIMHGSLWLKAEFPPALAQALAGAERPDVTASVADNAGTASARL
jgi:hypothetical protein